MASIHWVWPSTFSRGRRAAGMTSTRWLTGQSRCRTSPGHRSVGWDTTETPTTDGATTSISRGLTAPPRHADLPRRGWRCSSLVADDRRGKHSDHELSGAEIGWLLAALIAVGGFAWVVPTSVALLASGEVPHLAVPRAVIAVGRIVGDGLWSEPRSAYPAGVRALMPAGAVWWAFALPAFALAAVLLDAGWRRLEPAISREVLGRRPYDVRGARPRA